MSDWDTDSADARQNQWDREDGQDAADPLTALQALWNDRVAVEQRAAELRGAEQATTSAEQVPAERIVKGDRIYVEDEAEWYGVTRVAVSVKDVQIWLDGGDGHPWESLSRDKMLWRIPAELRGKELEAKGDRVRAVDTEAIPPDPRAVIGLKDGRCENLLRLLRVEMASDTDPWRIGLVRRIDAILAAPPPDPRGAEIGAKDDAVERAAKELADAAEAVDDAYSDAGPTMHLMRRKIVAARAALAAAVPEKDYADRVYDAGMQAVREASAGPAAVPPAEDGE